MVELEKNVMKKIKERIIEAEPKPGFVDGPWQLFAKQQQAMKHKNARAAVIVINEGNIDADADIMK